MMKQRLNKKTEAIVVTRSLVDGRMMADGCLEQEWQEFVLDRQNNIDCKLEYQHFSGEYVRLSEELKKLLANFSEQQMEKINETILAYTSVATYMHYNKGFYDGARMMILLSRL